jgi:hypothetical protein
MADIKRNALTKRLEGVVVEETDTRELVELIRKEASTPVEPLTKRQRKARDQEYW